MRLILGLLLICGCLQAAATADLDARVVRLLDALERNHNRQLYYDYSLFTPPMWALIKVDGIGPLIIAHQGAHDAKTYRFSVVTCLIHRIKISHQQTELAAIGAALVGDLKDADPWIRTESVWGIREIGYAAAPELVQPLLTDADANVRDEAAGTYAYLVDLAGKSL